MIGGMDEAPVERFKPTDGIILGWSGMAVCVLVVVYVAVAEHSVTGLRIGAAGAFGAALVWTTQLRPRVTAYTDALVVHRSLSDVTVPYLAIQDVTMGQTLNVWAEGRRYVCTGIGKALGFDTRQRMRAHGSGGLLGANRVTQLGRPEPGATRERGTSYHAFVMSRIHDLLGAARLQRREDAPVPPVRTTYAVPELVAVVLSTLVFLLSLLL